MKYTIIVVLTILLFCNGSCENKGTDVSSAPVDEVQNGGLTSKETILEALQEEHPDLEENDVCIVEVEEFDNLFIMGYFAYDLGCTVNRMFFNGVELPGDHTEANQIMAANNFKDNSEKLVENYHIYVINSFKTVIWETNEDFGNKFSKPQTRIENDKVISELWIQRPSGMIKERSYYLSKLTFDADGNFVSLEKSNQFSVAY
ncbi:hypothetical protein [Parvicella tangerina]|uniref:Uncharacterized protein n=1 Tax=Parvicella tangerina TaxID=2829795 RepID=A0A916NA81_9FLAO|nr:hypothetical protein [Parvicella tangerina]CAG5080285.1 hypothetical protein CRYO30217_01245 [Parvicella tangerina]